MNADVSQKLSEVFIIIIIIVVVVVVVVVIWMSLVTGLFSPIFLLNQR